MQQPVYSTITNPLRGIYAGGDTHICTNINFDRAKGVHSWLWSLSFHRNKVILKLSERGISVAGAHSAAVPWSSLVATGTKLRRSSPEKITGLGWFGRKLQTGAVGPRFGGSISCTANSASLKITFICFTPFFYTFIRIQLLNLTHRVPFLLSSRCHLLSYVSNESNKLFLHVLTRLTSSSKR